MFRVIQMLEHDLAPLVASLLEQRGLGRNCLDHHWLGRSYLDPSKVVQ